MNNREIQILIETLEAAARSAHTAGDYLVWEVCHNAAGTLEQISRKR